MTLPNLSQLPTILRNGEPVLVKRLGAGTYRDGEQIESPLCCQFKIIANIVPIDGNKLAQVPEAQREMRNLEVYSTSVLKVEDTLFKHSDSKNCILEEGIEYEVKSVQNWGKFSVMRIVQKDAQENE